MRPLRALLVAVLLHCQAAAGLAGVSAQPAASLARDARSRDEIRHQLVAVAESQKGVRELTNHNDGAQVQKYLHAVGLKGNWPWCAAFVVWCIKQIGLNPNANGAAHSFFTPKTKKWPGVPGAEPPQPGDPHGYRFVRRDIDHVGIIKFWGTAPLADVIEGNTSSRKADRDGQGVYEKWVLKSQIAEVADLFKCVK